ncbi:MAG: glycosyltransferase [Zetaproteobacteria bacterium]|nr:glycosyltransferase [Zetaproteobacteria bacterium]
MKNNIAFIHILLGLMHCLTPIAYTQNHPQPKKILILSSNTGGGHRASALALQAAFAQSLPPTCEIQIVDFWVDLAQGQFVHMPKQYAFLAKHPWLWKLSYEVTRTRAGHFALKSYLNAFAHHSIRRAFEKIQPELIVSVHPLVNDISQRVLRKMYQKRPQDKPHYVTVVTDLGSAHPAWFHPEVDKTYVPSGRVFQDALQAGVAPEKIIQLGLPIRKAFWSVGMEQKAAKEHLGLDPHKALVLLIGGGDGVGNLSNTAKAIAAQLAGTPQATQTQLAVICGNNLTLRHRLQQHAWPLATTIHGFTHNLDEWMSAADILATKAGPGTIAESLIRGLPLLLTSFLPGQEKYNVDYVLQHGLGVFADRPQNIAQITSQWLQQPQQLQKMSERAREIARPRAALDIAQHILQAL